MKLTKRVTKGVTKIIPNKICTKTIIQNFTGSFVLNVMELESLWRIFADNTPAKAFLNNHVPRTKSIMENTNFSVNIFYSQ